MSGNINFYETDKVKKKNQTRKDEQVEHTGIKLRTRNLLCGASGSGKTNALMNYIFLSSKPRKGTFRHVFLCYKTDEPLYDVLQEQLKDKITVFKIKLMCLLLSHSLINPIMKYCLYLTTS